MKDLLKWLTESFRMSKMLTYKGVFAGGKNSIGLSVKELKRLRAKNKRNRVSSIVPTTQISAQIHLRSVEGTLTQN
jgi:hypothetical protein